MTHKPQNTMMTKPRDKQMTNHLLVYLRLIIGILSLCTSAHLTVLSLSNPALNLTFSLLPITYSHPHASVWLTLTLTTHPSEPHDPHRTKTVYNWTMTTTTQ